VGANIAGEKIETVVFNAGVAKTGFPVKTIKSLKWVGDEGGAVTFTPNHKELYIDNDAYRIAQIGYTVEYDRIHLANHNVEKLLLLLKFDTNQDVSLTVRMGSGERPASAGISNNLLTDNNSAKLAGQAYLDKERYDRRILNYEAVYDDNAIDGKVAYLNDSEAGLSANVHIVAADILIEGAKVTNKIEAEHCQP
jgi:hypothetical protein